METRGTLNVNHRISKDKTASARRTSEACAAYRKQHDGHDRSGARLALKTSINPRKASTASLSQTRYKRASGAARQGESVLDTHRVI